jgi:hypothetical protein
LRVKGVSKAQTDRARFGRVGRKLHFPTPISFGRFWHVEQYQRYDDFALIVIWVFKHVSKASFAIFFRPALIFGMVIHCALSF